MAVVGLVKTSWSGTSGGPGLTQLAITASGLNQMTVSEANVATAAVRTFWDAIKAVLPDEIVVAVSPIVDHYDTGSGDLVASVTASSQPASVQGTSTSNYSMAAGLKMNLSTGTIRDGRRVRGSVFIVPAASSAFTTTGTAASGTRTTIDTAGNAMRTTLTNAGLTLVVWSRFREATATLEERQGITVATTGVDTSEKTAILRGRRD